MNRTLRLVIIILSVMLSITDNPFLFAQADSSKSSESLNLPRTPLWIGFGAGVNYLQFSTDGNLRCLGDPACPAYSGAGILAPSFGASLDWRFSGSFGLLLRVAYNAASVSLHANDDRARTFDASGNITPLIRQHDLNVKSPHINADLLANFINGNLRFFGGAEFGLLISPKWESKSTILSPANVTFGNNRRDTLFLPETSISDAKVFQTGIVIGAGYDFYLSPKLMLTPELHGALPLSAILEKGDLRMYSAALSVSLRFGSGMVKTEKKQYRRLFDTVAIETPTFTGNKFAPGKNITQIDVVETADERITTETMMRRDTIFHGTKKIAEPPKPSAPIAVLYITSADTAGKIKQVNEIVARGRIVTEAFPVLPMIFFEKNAASPALRYHLLASPDGFSEDKLPAYVLEQHKEALNIIGSRMRDNPKTKITLIGAADEITENADCQLAEARARAVKDYLATTWGVDESRVRIKKSNRKCSPESPTISPIEAGFAENRRVEIESDDDEILLAPVLREKYIEQAETEPQKFIADPTGSSSENFKSWEIWANYEKTRFGAINGIGRPAEKQIAIPDEIARTLNYGELGTVDVTLAVADANGQTARQVVEIPVRRDTLLQAVERLSLMHFQVLKDKLNRAAKSAIKRFISDLDDDATVNIVGYTDNLGDPELNSRLSNGRATEVANYIKRLKPSVNIIRNEGVAATKFPPGISSHDIPESRILSRTVQIEIIRNRR